jgi:hypothetical protein
MRPSANCGSSRQGKYSTQPPSPEERQTKQQAVQLMRNDPAMRSYFLDKVAGPVANKLFECGMIP